MDKYSGLPSWVQKSKKSLKQSQEWQTFMMKLYDLVHHQMQEMGVSSFNDLAPPERQLLLQRGFHALKTSDTYFHLLEVASESLDESISKEADKLSSTKKQNKTKIEILQEECHNAVTSLLQKWPDSRTSLRQCLNANIPLELRYVTWKNFLKNPKAREEYLILVASDPKRLVSKIDFEISEKCHMLLESDPTLKQIPNRKAVCSIMRHLLSHWHNKLGGRGTLAETDFLLTIPLVVCTLAAKQMLAHSISEKQLTTESLATLVEEFHAFMHKRPAYMSTQGASLEDLSSKTAAILRRQDVGLGRAIEGYKIGQKELPNAKLEDVLPLLLHSVVRSLFVGYFPIETVLHAWDIIILGFDRPNYDAVPYLCATIFLLLRKDLIKSRSEKEASTILIQGCRSIHKDQLMLALKEYDFEKQLKENLDIADEDQFPVFHPALKSNLPPWKHWYSNKIIAQMEAERNEGTKRIVTDPISPGPSRLATGHDVQFWQLEQMKLELEEETDRLREERDALATDIEKERRLRIEMQQHADEEIDRLTRQLNALQRTSAKKIVPTPVKQRTPTPPETARKEVTPIKTPEKVETPPPKPESKPPTPKQETPVQRQVSEVVTPRLETPTEIIKAKKMTDDILAKMMDAVSLLAHGNQKDRKDLDKMMQKDTQKLTAALRKAQINVYGKPMSDEDFLKLPLEEREQKGTKLQEETIRLLFKKK